MKKPNAVERFIKGRESLLTYVGDYVAEAGAAGQFVGVAGLASFSASRHTWGSPPYVSVSMTVEEGASTRAVVKHAMRIVGAVKAEKKFDDATGAVVYKFKTAGWDVTIIGGAPAACEVEEYTEEVVTAATPESRESVKKFRLVDPKCLGQNGEPDGAPPPKTQEEKEALLDPVKVEENVREMFDLPPSTEKNS